MEEIIIEDVLAENIRLRKELNKYTGKYFTGRISILSLEPTLKITGVLIAEGVWKGIKYTYNEMKKALSKFKGLGIMVMHGKNEDFKDKIVGKVTKVETNDTLKSILFEGEITDKKAIELIKDGTFNAVSPRGEFGKVDTSKIPPIGLDYEPIELSLTSMPACRTCLIYQMKQLSLNKDIEDINIVSKMSEEIEIKENHVLVIPEDFEELEDFSVIEMELMDIDEFIDLQKKRKRKRRRYRYPYAYRIRPGRYPRRILKVIKYYGYPYPYYYYYPYYPYYPYYYPYYYYASEDLELLDLLPLEADYKKFMAECLKEGKTMKECAIEWREKYPAPGMEEETELAEVKCPVCGEVFPSRRKFLAHWAEAHEAKYGAYGQVKKLVKKLLEDATFRKTLKKLIVSLEEKESGQEETKEEVEETEAKGKEEKAEETKETVQVEEKEKVEEKETEERKEEETKEKIKEETVTEKPKTTMEVVREIVKESTPEELGEICAELLVESWKKTE